MWYLAPVQLWLSSEKAAVGNLLGVRSKKIGHSLLAPGSNAAENNQTTCHTAFGEARTGPAFATAALLAAEAQGKLLTVCLSSEDADRFVMVSTASFSMYKPV